MHRAPLNVGWVRLRQKHCRMTHLKAEVPDNCMRSRDKKVRDEDEVKGQLQHRQHGVVSRNFAVAKVPGDSHVMRTLRSILHQFERQEEDVESRDDGDQPAPPRQRAAARLHKAEEECDDLH